MRSSVDFIVIILSQFSPSHGKGFSKISSICRRKRVSAAVYAQIISEFFIQFCTTYHVFYYLLCHKFDSCFIRDPCVPVRFHIQYIVIGNMFGSVQFQYRFNCHYSYLRSEVISRSFSYSYWHGLSSVWSDLNCVRGVLRFYGRNRLYGLNRHKELLHVDGGSLVCTQVM